MVFLRLAGISPIWIHPQFTTVSERLAQNRNNALVVGLFFGLAAAMALYNLFIYVSLREVRFPTYFLYVAAVSFYVFVREPLTAGLVNFTGMPRFLVAVAGFNVIIVAALLFIYTFLELKERQPRTGRVFLVLAAVFALLAGISPFGEGLMNNSLYPSGPVLIILMLGASVRSWIQGYRPARFIVLGVAGFIIVGGEVYSLLGQGWLPPNDYTVHALRLGFAVEMMLFTIALANRINLLRAERTQARLELVARLRREKSARAEHSRHLGAEVSARTAELRELNTAKNRLFSIVAHDLRGPLGEFLDATRLLGSDDGTTSPKEIREATGGLHGIANTTNTLLDNLLQWSRFQMDQVAINPVPFNAHDVAMAVVEFSARMAAAKDVGIEWEGGEEPTIYADRNMISTVLRNLVGNAIKYGNPGGKILLSCNQDRDQVRLAIADSGIGIPPDTRAKLFRLDETITTPGTLNEKGAGLGLILCKEMVEKNGGKIWVESTPGAGATFEFSLPASGGPDA